MQNIQVTTKTAKRLKNNLLNKSENRLQITEEMIIASLLDPNSRDEPSVNVQLESQNKTIVVFLRDACRKHLKLTENNPVSHEKNYNIDDGETNDYKLCRSYLRNRTITEEIQQYLKVKDKPSDILQWWKENTRKFKRLSQLAKKILCINAFSSDVESQFSIMGQIIQGKRSTLAPEKAEILGFMHGYYHNTNK